MACQIRVIESETQVPNTGDDPKIYRQIREMNGMPNPGDKGRQFPDALYRLVDIAGSLTGEKIGYPWPPSPQSLDHVAHCIVKAYAESSIGFAFDHISGRVSLPPRKTRRI